MNLNETKMKDSPPIFDTIIEGFENNISRIDKILCGIDEKLNNIHRSDALTEKAPNPIVSDRPVITVTDRLLQLVLRLEYLGDAVSMIDRKLNQITH